MARKYESYKIKVRFLDGKVEDKTPLDNDVISNSKAMTSMYNSVKNKYKDMDCIIELLGVMANGSIEVKYTKVIESKESKNMRLNKSIDIIAKEIEELKNTVVEKEEYHKEMLNVFNDKRVDINKNLKKLYTNKYGSDEELQLEKSRMLDLIFETDSGIDSHKYELEQTKEYIKNIHNEEFEFNIEDDEGVTTELEKGEMYWCDLGNDKSENIQSGIRPCILVSNSKGNKHSNVVTIVPLTSKNKKSNLPVHFELTGNYRENEPKNSMALCEQVRTINKNKLKRYINKLTVNDMTLLNKSLRVAFKI